MTVWMEFTNSTPKRRALAEKNVRTMREEGYSYEEIPDHLFHIDTGATAAPWEIYEVANPTKTAEQVAAWKARHHPHG
jgi:hypothetical protein